MGQSSLCLGTVTFIVLFSFSTETTTNFRERRADGGTDDCIGSQRDLFYLCSVVLNVCVPAHTLMDRGFALW